MPITLTLTYPPEVDRRTAARATRFLAQLFVLFGFKGTLAVAAQSMGTPTECLTAFAELAAHDIVITIDPASADARPETPRTKGAPE